MNRILLFAAVLAFATTPVVAWATSHDHAEGDHGHGHWMAPADAQAISNPVAPSAESLEIGAALYRDNCAACHGADGRGNGSASATLETAPADLAQMAPTHGDGDFAWKISNGRGEMPAWKGLLSTDQIWHVVNYVKHLPRLASIASEGHDHADDGHHHGSSGQPHVD